MFQQRIKNTPIHRQRRRAKRVLSKLQKQKNWYPNFAIIANERISLSIVVEGFFEAEELDFFIKWINYQGFELQGTAIDIGANIGNHSVFFARYFEQVLSFEPNPVSYYFLKYNSSLEENIETYNVGISDSNKNSFLKIPDNDIGGCGAYISNHGGTPIQLVKLDDFLETKYPITLIKIDIEGYELNALRGMNKVLEFHKPMILFEQLENEFQKNGKNNVIEYLSALGYTKFAYIENENTTKYSRKQGYFSKKIHSLKRDLGLLKIKMFVTDKDCIPARYHTFIIAIHKDNVKKYRDL